MCGSVRVCLSIPFERASSGRSVAGHFKSILLLGCVCVCTNAAYVDSQLSLTISWVPRHVLCDAVGAASSCLSVTLSVLRLWSLIICRGVCLCHSCELDFPLPLLSPLPLLGLLALSVSSLLVGLILCVVSSVSVGGPLWLSVWLWQAVYREACCCQCSSLQCSVCLEVWEALHLYFPLNPSPLCFVCLYQYWFVSISG